MTKTTTTPRVVRDRKAEALADSTLSLAGRFGDRVPAEKLGHALRIVGWREGADAANRANDPACGQPAGWKSRIWSKALSALESKLGRPLTVEEIAAFDDGYAGAIALGSN